MIKFISSPRKHPGIMEKPNITLSRKQNNTSCPSLKCDAPIVATKKRKI